MRRRYRSRIDLRKTRPSPENKAADQQEGHRGHHQKRHPKDIDRKSLALGAKSQPDEDGDGARTDEPFPPVALRLPARKLVVSLQDGGHPFWLQAIAAAPALPGP